MSNKLLLVLIILQGFNGMTLGLTAKLNRPYIKSIGMNLSPAGEKQGDLNLMRVYGG
jgi:hypothetical protein